MKQNKATLYLLFLSFALLIINANVTSNTLKPFADELVSLTANFGFFNNFDFRAGNNLLGGQGYSYSVLNSSGPFSAVGSVIAWSLTKNIYLTRLFNFIFVLIVNTVLSYKITTHFDLDSRYIVLSNLTLVTIPWWYGSLYSLGELPSIIIFFYAIILFNKNRLLSMVLFSFSIFFSKLILLLFFGGFYSTYIFNQLFTNKKINFGRVFKDFFTFLVPMLVWLVFVHLYSDFGVFQYFDDLINYLILNHQSSDTSQFSNFSFLNIALIIQNMQWSIVDIYKVLFFPLFTIFILIKHKREIIKKLNLEIYGAVGSISAFYIWFWLFSTTKWIKYSSQMIYICLGFVLLFLFIAIQNRNRIYILVASLSLLLFTSSLTVLIVSLLLFSFYFLTKKDLITLFTIIFLLSGSNLLFETTRKETFEINIQKCEEQLLNKICVLNYLGLKF